MEALKQLPIGIQNFEKLRKDDYLYIDKTALLYELVTTGCYYFLSRPRRFGKSMLLSTLHAYFEGKKDLFEGLAITELEKNWTKYPVLHLDLNLTEYKSEDSLDNILDTNLRKWETLYGAKEYEKSYALRFAGVVERACQVSGQRVVILVDEYDKPILQTIDNEEIQSRYRSTLKSFYGVLKSMDGYIKFALLTGVTKFGKVSVFSDLNNLEDISMDRQYDSVCGITDDEIDTVLKPYVQRLADADDMDYDDVRCEMKARYDGYHFSKKSIAIYNPFSVLNALKKYDFGSYWFETGTPTYLAMLLKKHNYSLDKIDGIQVGEKTLNSIDASSTNPIPVIYQSGYLTIKGYDRETGLYALGFPNKEVESGFIDFLLPYYTSIDETQTEFIITKFIEDIRAGKVDTFMERLQSIFAGTNYDLKLENENNYQNAIYLILKLMGQKVAVEYRTSYGCIDMTLETKEYFYVFEFKFDGSAEQALAQINDKDYILPFKFTDKKLIKVGVNFSPKNLNIDRWIIE